MQVLLTIQAVRPSRRSRIYHQVHPDPLKGRLTLEISHESLGSRIQSVNDHLPIGWTGDFDPAYQLELHHLVQKDGCTSYPRALELGERKTKLCYS